MLNQLTESNLNDLLNYFNIKFTKFTSVRNKFQWVKDTLNNSK